MKKTKEILILGIIFMLIFIFVTPVKAEEISFKTEVSTSKKNIKAGDTVEVIVSVKDINMGENGINTLEGTISYDKDIFEKVKNSDIKSANNWSTTYNDEGTALDGKFLAVTLNHGIKEDTQLLTITLKTKKDIEETTITKIELKDLTSNNGNNLVNTGTKSVDVKIEVEKTNQNLPEDNNTENNNINQNIIGGNNTGSSNTGTSNIKNTTTTQPKVDNTKSQSGLPKTGKTSLIVLAIVIGIILLIVFGIKTKNMKGI